MNYEYAISKDEIIVLHDMMIDKYGGTYGILDEGLLDNVSVTPYQEVFGTFLYPSVIDKATKYFVSFADYQIFQDGNKRTAAIILDVYLSANGYTLKLTNNTDYNLKYVRLFINNKYRGLYLLGYKERDKYGSGK